MVISPVAARYMDAVADPAPDKMREPALAILLMEDMALTSASDRIESFLLERGPRSERLRNCTRLCIMRMQDCASHVQRHLSMRNRR